MGVVYLATQLRLDRAVALKILDERFAQDPQFLARFDREARAVAKLQHPAIVEVHDLFQAEGAYCLVMEYLPGGSTRTLLERAGPLSAERVVAIGRAAAEGLWAASEAGYVHRDVKPDNLLITARGDVKVADFGLTRHLEEDRKLTVAGSVMGTAAYMSPEQWEDCRSSDHRSDLYSLGCTLFELLVGAPPYPGPSVANFMNQHMKGPTPDACRARPGVSAELGAVLAALLERDPSRRPESGKVLAERLGACARGAAAEAAAGRSDAPTLVTGSSQPADGAGETQAAAAITGLHASPMADPQLPRRPHGSRLVGVLAAGALATLALAGLLSRQVSPERESRAQARVQPRSLLAGETEVHQDGRVRLRYDFGSEAQLADWVLEGEGEAAIVSGGLEVWGGEPAVLRLRTPLRAERVNVVAACLEPEEEGSAHINVYLNTRWQGSWEGSWGVGAIMRGDGLLFTADGVPEEDGALPPPACEVGHRYLQQLVMDPGGTFTWSIDGQQAMVRRLPALAGRSGSVLIGAYGARTRFEEVEIYGWREP